MYSTNYQRNVMNGRLRTPYRAMSSIIRDELLGGLTKSKKGLKGQKKTLSEKESSDQDKQAQMMLRALTARNVKEPPAATEEEMERRYNLGRNYVIGCFKRHNVLKHDLACKMKMKQHALNMLPHKSMWKEEALKIHEEDEPLQWRVLPTPHVPTPELIPEHMHRPKEEVDHDDFYY